MEIQVVPEALAATGAALTAAGGDALGVAGQLGATAHGAAAACGFPSAAGALEAMWSSWERALVQSGQALGATGTGVTDAAAV